MVPQIMESFTQALFLGQSQSVKNRNLSRLISNLNRLNCSSEFKTVFIVFQQCLLFYNGKKYPVRVYTVIFPV